MVINNEALLSDKKLESLVTSRYFQSSALKAFYLDLIDSCNTILVSLDQKKLKIKNDKTLQKYPQKTGFRKTFCQLNKHLPKISHL